MEKRKVGFISTIAAFAMAACTFATIGMAKGVASADEVEDPTPAPAAEQGWYIVGNGAGSLKNCSWTEYKSGFKLDGVASKTGEFTFEDLELYEGDAFKILYANGVWQWPSQSGWTADVMAQYSNLVGNTGEFVDGGLGNIQATVAGQGVYDLTLRVSETVSEEGVVTTNIALSFEKTSSVTPIAQEEMYVVGSLANYPTCNWPGSIDVKTCCPAMTLTGNKWTVTLNLKAGDQFKVYNLVNNGYFPSGMNNDCIIAEDGTYEIEYEVKAPSFIVTNTVTHEVVYR